MGGAYYVDISGFDSDGFSVASWDMVDNSTNFVTFYDVPSHVGGITGDIPGEVVIQATVNGITTKGQTVTNYPITTSAVVYSVTIPDNLSVFLGDSITVAPSVVPAGVFDITDIPWSGITPPAGSGLGKVDVTANNDGTITIQGVTLGMASIRAGEFDFENAVQVLEKTFSPVFKVPANGTVTLPFSVDALDVVSESFKVLVDWGDGSAPQLFDSTVDPAAPSHTYSNESEQNYTIHIWDKQDAGFDAWSFRTSSISTSNNMLVDVAHWGNETFVDVNDMFRNCGNLVGFSATDTPKFKGTVASMFRKATNFNHDITAWDVSLVTNMDSMFYTATAFNNGVAIFKDSPLAWGNKTGNVTSMINMFAGTPSNGTGFNQDISSWNVSKVENMSGMFAYTRFFNQNIGGWDVRSLIRTTAMFQWAGGFHNGVHGIVDLDTSEISYPRTQPITWTYDHDDNTSTPEISATSNIKYMDYMFMGVGTADKRHGFNQDISGWDTSAVETMEHMFTRANSFNQDLSNWDLSSVTNMKYMFYNNSSFSQDMTGWTNWDVASKGKGILCMFLYDTNSDGEVSGMQDTSKHPPNCWDRGITDRGCGIEHLESLTITGPTTVPISGEVTLLANNASHATWSIKKGGGSIDADTGAYTANYPIGTVTIQAEW